MRLVRSIRGQVGLLSGGLLFLVVLVFGIFIYYSFRAQLFRSLDDGLRLDAEQLLVILEAEEVTESFRFESNGARLRSEESFLRLVTPDGAVVTERGKGRLPVSRDQLGETTTIVTRTYYEDDEEYAGDGESSDLESLRLLSTPVRQSGEIIAYLQVGRDLESLFDTLGRLLTLLLLAGVSMILLAGLGGAWLAGRALAPIEAIRARASSLSARDLSRRLDLDLPDDEVGRLARTFNEMLTRLDASFRRQRRFTADASHELRTPLSIIQGEVDVTLDQPRSGEEYRAALERIGGESERMSRLVSDLLLLARGDADHLRLEKERVDLADLLQVLVDESRTRAAEADVSFQLDLPNTLLVEADPDRLLQLFLNLFQNVFTHAPGSLLTVRAESLADRVRIVLSDDGPGIPSEDLPHIFDPFYRVDSARSAGGSGLGLSICREIVNAHGGQIRAASEPGAGTRFTIELPPAPR